MHFFFRFRIFFILLIFIFISICLYFLLENKTIKILFQFFLHFVIFKWDNFYFRFFESIIWCFLPFVVSLAVSSITVILSTASSPITVASTFLLFDLVFRVILLHLIFLASISILLATISVIIVLASLVVISSVSSSGSSSHQFLVLFIFLLYFIMNLLFSFRNFLIYFLGLFPFTFPVWKQVLNKDFDSIRDIELFYIMTFLNDSELVHDIGEILVFFIFVFVRLIKQVTNFIH